MVIDYDDTKKLCVTCSQQIYPSTPNDCGWIISAKFIFWTTLYTPRKSAEIVHRALKPREALYQRRGEKKVRSKRLDIE